MLGVLALPWSTGGQNAAAVGMARGAVRRTESSSPVDYARMGAMSIKSAAAGTLFFDEFESRRQRRIGPE